MTEPTGRRERKKALTRQALADAALSLFLERGYDQVGVKDIADAADVSVSTLFKHFPSKESLVFDREDDVEAALVAAVRERAPGKSIPRALREHIGRLSSDFSESDILVFTRLIESTPALRAYSHHMWMRHQVALAKAIAEEVGTPENDPAAAALARFALESRDLIHQHADQPDAADAIFALLEHGWAALHPQRS